MPISNLTHYLDASARRWPARTAVVDPSGEGLSYAELYRRVDGLAKFLNSRGIGLGDRVGIVLPKSAASVTAAFAIMKAGAAYVPVDVTAPVERGKGILTDCGVKAVFVDSAALAVLPDATDDSPLEAIVVGSFPDAPSNALTRMTPFDTAIEFSGNAVAVTAGRTDLAYILYTSGSTGVPKGVMLSHENAISFVDWCSPVFQPTEHDRFSSHAPFHFDLSVLDIYLSIKHGATLFLISEELGKNPKALTQFVASHRLTVWYSTPSILTLMLQFGELAAHDVPELRLVLFAGEVFPVKHLRELQRHWFRPDYYNLYGPTETNVCTFARVPRVPDDREVPYPIGFACAHCESLVLDDEGRPVPAGAEGLLFISGASVFQGYWNRPVENANAFIDRDGRRWYNTGDLVRWDALDGFVYAGRKDRMVKRRGYRIELGEIERTLYLEPRVTEAAVVAVPDAETGVRIVAFITADAGTVPSIIELKAFCGRMLPAYMNPDRFVVLEGKLPKTSTDKTDYQGLRARALAIYADAPRPSALSAS